MLVHFKTWSRLVTSHSGNTFNYATVPSWKTKHHYYYFEGRREFLDQAGEWWYDTYNDADSLYYYANNGVDPNKLDFRGKVQSYAFSITGSEYIQIKNLEFFGKMNTNPRYWHGIQLIGFELGFEVKVETVIPENTALTDLKKLIFSIFLIKNCHFKASKNQFKNIIISTITIINQCSFI